MANSSRSFPSAGVSFLPPTRANHALGGNSDAGLGYTGDFAAFVSRIEPITLKEIRWRDLSSYMVRFPVHGSGDR